MIRFWDFQLSGAPPLRGLVVRQSGEQSLETSG